MHGDSGQVFPIYITVVAGLLFLAFAYFAVGQAAVNRNGAQTAADAAALAAALETRDQLAGKWVEDVLDPAQWQNIFDGNVELEPACPRALELAAQNDARVDDCHDGIRTTVEVQANKPVGDSVIPITSTQKAHASATAVVESLCKFPPLGDDAADDALPKLTCKDGEEWDLDPKDLSELPKPEDLFDVHLAND